MYLYASVFAPMSVCCIMWVNPCSGVCLRSVITKWQTKDSTLVRSLNVFFFWGGDLCQLGQLTFLLTWIVCSLCVTYIDDLLSWFGVGLISQEVILVCYYFHLYVFCSSLLCKEVILVPLLFSSYFFYSFSYLC